MRDSISKKKIILIAAIAAVILLAVCAALFYNSGIKAPEPGNEEPIAVEIPVGTGSSAILDILDEKGLVKNKLCAKIHLRLGNYDALQANTWIFNKSMDIEQILTAMNEGDFTYVSKSRIGFIEGSNIPQAAESIAKEMPFTKEEILAKWNDKDYLNTLIDKYWFLTDDILQEGIMYPLEGYLYPETYFVTGDSPTIEYVTEMLLDMTEKELEPRREAIEASGMSVHRFLTMASVVQDESMYAKDRPKIAGVFFNRLEKGMPLQSDSTVLYAVQSRHIDVTYAELAVDSPYNTYMYTGLPIGPICATPGSTWDDVLNYEKSDYLFFFAKEDGNLIYSKTLAEHEKAVSENLWY